MNNNRWLAQTVGIALVLGAAGVSTMAAAEVPKAIEGKWTLDVSKSTFGADKPMQSDMFVLTMRSEGLWHNALDWVEADGTKVHLEYDTAFDGKKAPVTGGEGADGVTASFPKPDDLKLVLYHGATRVQWGHFKLSPDGKTLQGPLDGVEADGSKWHYHFVWKHDQP